jgi:putative glycosyltransferase
VRLSVVTSVYRTAQFLEAFAARVDAAARSCGMADYEMIFVVDGSPDNAVAELTRLKARFPAIRSIELSRNFGHHPALWCGLAAATGELIFLADSDLETPPETLVDLYAALEDERLDMAFAVQRRRAGSWLGRATSLMFWRVFNLLAETRMQSGMLTERLMRRRYLDALLQLNERALFLSGMMGWIGFEQTAVFATRTPRSGPPSYTWFKRANLAFDAIISFSDVPMKVMFVLGSGLAALTFLGALALVVGKLADPGLILPGFTVLVALMLFSLGVTIAAIGVVGLYLGKVFLQTKGRPLYVVRRQF